MKTKHTPGPWHHDEYGHICAKSQIIGSSYQFELDDSDNDELPCLENARLMAAAPEMLKFIQRVAHWELVDCDQHEYVMEDEEVRVEAHRILNAYNERLKLTDQ